MVDMKLSGWMQNQKAVAGRYRSAKTRRPLIIITITGQLIPAQPQDKICNCN